MPFARNHRADPRRSSPYCSTTNIVVLFALCLVGIWMMTSSTDVNVPSDNTKSEVKQEISENDAKQFQDSNGDLSVDAGKANINTVSNNIAEATAQVDDSAKENDASKQESVATSLSENGAYSDANGKLESGETVKNDEEIAKEEGDSKSGAENTNTEEKEDNRDKMAENSVNENTNSEQEKGNNQNSDQTENGEKGKEKTLGQESDQTETKDNGDNSMKQENESNGNIVQEERVGNQKNDEKENSEEKKADSENSEEKKAESENSEEKRAESENSEEIKAERDNSEEKKAESENSEEKKAESENYREKKAESQGANELLPSGAQSELLNETNTQNGAWSTQASESKNEKEVQASSTSKVKFDSSSWKLCNVTAGPDYIPCLDNEEAIKKLRTTGHYEHRERHCPENPLTCLVPLPDGYIKSIEWPSSRDKIWYHNVPHTKLAVVKGHQNWVKVSGEYLTFPGGGTQFKHGALHYIDVIQESLPDIAWGKRSRVVLDVGCGVASFGGYLFDRDVLTMSFAPKDEHEAQVQFALERGIPAISAVMGTKRLPFPGRVFDVIHCARCRVPWHIEGGKLLLELNRILRPGGYFVWSATPVYQKLAEDVQIWKDMTKLMKVMCWDMVVKTRDSVDKVGLAIFRKPSNNTCYEKRMETSPPFCQDSDDPNAAWNVPLQTCMHKLPVDPAVRGSQWPEKWPVRLTKPPYWLNDSQIGVYGKPAPEDFKADQEHWNTVVSKSYMSGMGIDWSKVRNVMDMRAVYGGFAAALKDMKLWVMNIVSIDSPDTLPIIYERGLFGMYHDWCESFSTYPRSYDLLHADHLFSRIKKKCKILPLMVEVDRMLRPEGKLIVRDTADTVSEVESIAKSLKWEIRMTFTKKNEGILCVMKTTWRPKEMI